MSKPLKKDFLWGSSTNAQQFEGAWNEGGKGLNIADVRKLKGDFSNFKIASDHYHHLKEDIALYGEMGFGTYRFSIQWSRILPNGDDDIPNEEGLQFYEKMVSELEKYNIIPVATLYAYDLPYALLKKYGGWMDSKCVDAYLKYVKIIFKRFKGRIKYYTPFNEPNLFHVDYQYIAGNKNLANKEIWQAEHHLTMAYAKCVHLCHEIDPDAKIGPNCALQIIYPATCHPKDAVAALKEMYMLNYAYLDAYVRGEYPQYFLNNLERIDALPKITAEDKQIMKTAEPDLISTTYYSTHIRHANKTESEGNPYCDTTEWGWTIDPDGFYYQLMEMYYRYHKPILILENGMAHTEKPDKNNKIVDDYRIDYLAEHIKSMKKAIEDGVDVIGYLTWSAIDLHSTREGFGKRYGFVYVDRDEHEIRSLKRIKKKSFYWYKKVIATNGEDLENDIDY